MRSSAFKFMVFKSLKEPIVRLVLILFFVFVFSMAGLTAGQYYTMKRIKYLQSLKNNEIVKLELSYLIHIKLQRIRSELMNMLLAVTEPEMRILSGRVDKDLKDLREYISVIDKGGRTVHEFSVNFENEEKVNRIFTYANHFKGRFNLEILEMNAKLIELEKYVDQLKEMIGLRIAQSENENQEFRHNNIFFFYKGIKPFLDRVIENSQRIYFNAIESFERIDGYIVETKQAHLLRHNTSKVVILSILLGLTFVILLQIVKIVKERRSFQEALQESNENLEEKIRERTVELEQQIEERKHAEEQERAQAEYLKFIIDSLEHPFYVIDVENFEILLRNRYASLMGTESTLHCYTLTHNRMTPCDGREHPCPVKEVLKTKRPVRLEHIHYDFEGNPVYVDVYGYPIMDEDGAVRRMIQYSLDVTSKKKVEMALEETNRNLEKIVAQRTAILEQEVFMRKEAQTELERNIKELEIAREAAEASNRSKSEFLSRMSHELRTPLNAINGFSDLMLRDKLEVLSDRHRDYVVQINSSGRHLLDLINEILDLSRIEFGSLTLVIEDVDLVEVIKASVSMVEASASEKGVILDVDKGVYSMPHIMADFTRIKQVFLNLLSNAIKYNRPGGSVFLSFDEIDGMVIVKIIDSGIGIPFESQDDIFVPFNRIGQEERGVEGTGIGLTITKQIVELMHGAIGFSSSEGKGSAFYVKFPTVDSVMLKDGRLTSHYNNLEIDSEVDKKNITILLIESDSETISMMRVSMENLDDCSLIVRKNPEKGMMAAVMIKPDVIILDIDQPAIMGFETFKKLREKDETLHIPVVALTTKASPDTVSSYLDLGFLDCLIKPVETSILKKVISKIAGETVNADKS